ncbi:MAG: 50S ribosomal protein L18 [Candidatus Moranbacteria bacterium]|nr:50S ribosomal protein L18 [Candidatus Moranbacteria bacterium]
MKKVNRNIIRKRRKRRIRVKGNSKIPRLNVFRSNKSVYLQLIDDEAGKTIIGLLSDRKKDKTFQAFEAGKKLGKAAVEKKIKRAVFDRNGYKFHGRIKAVLEGASEAGLNFKK